MIRTLTALSLLLGTAIAAEPVDLLRLSNGELEGRFGGINRDGVVRWDREDGIAPIEFKPDKIRQIVLRGAKSIRMRGDSSHITLLNGDKIPGRVISLDAETVTLETDVAGTLVIPRDTVRSLAPNPFGGRLIYAGPFIADEWKIHQPGDKEEEKEAEAGEKAEDKETSDKGWRHVGSKWYHTAGDDALLLDGGMPQRAVYKFHLEWRSRPPIAVAFHADFSKPEINEDDDNEEKRQQRSGSYNSMVDAFGNSLVLTLRSSYAQLYRCGYDEDGDPFADQVRASSTMVRFEDTGEADFELRTDLSKGTVSLFVNGEYSMQWQLDPEELQAAEPKAEDPEDGDADEVPPRTPLGGGIGFQMMGEDAPIRVSDIVIAEWNGMPDSARSLESENSDVVLLTNGTDRFSGNVKSCSDGKLSLDGQYASLTVPMDEVAEIRFATSELREEEGTNGRQVRVHFQPLGRISGTPGISTGNKLQVQSPLMGELSIDLESAVILEFQSGNQFLNYWDEDL